jgi:UPF0755 protein
MKKKLRAWAWLLICLFLIIGVALGGFFWWQKKLRPAGGDLDRVFIIQKGEGLDSLAGRLEKEGFIQNSFAFRLLVLSQNLSKKIQAGSFRLSSQMGAQEIAEALTHGTLDVWVTFLEGWRSEEFAEELIKEGFKIEIDDWDSEVHGLGYEGCLFPDTYLIPRAASQATIIDILKTNFDKKFSSLDRRAASKNFTLHQIVTLASIVEREAKDNQDLAVVAGILIKRWQNNWPLQADATVQYAVADPNLKNWWPKDLGKQDLEIDSPYNTYRYQGLPPGPICNPGLASIKAVIDYQETDYWFYLSDSQGRLHYAKTIEEHNANIAEYLGK